MEEERNESVNGPEETKPSSIGRRQLLLALGATAGAVAAATFLPNGWVEPAIAENTKPTSTPRPKDKYTPTPTSTPTETPTATPTPTANPLSIDNLSISDVVVASFHYGCPGLEINDDNTYMHAEVSPYGRATEGSLRFLMGGPTQSNPTPLILRRQASSASEGSISFHWWPLATYGVTGNRAVPAQCSVDNGSTPAVLKFWLYTRSNTLNSSIRVCLPH